MLIIIVNVVILEFMLRIIE